MKKKLLTVKQLAKFLNRSESYIYKKVASNSMPHYKFEGSLYFDPKKVIKKIKSTSNDGLQNIEMV